MKRESLPYPAFLGEIWVQPVKDDDSVTLQRWGGITPLLIHGRSNQEYTPVDLRSAAKVHDSVADFLKEKYGSSEKQNQWGLYYVAPLSKLEKVIG